MKRQRNIQVVKEHDKCSPNQTKEEEIGSLPEKDFRIMIVNDPKSWKQNGVTVNILDKNIEKMQEKLNKDLEEI